MFYISSNPTRMCWVHIRDVVDFWLDALCGCIEILYTTLGSILSSYKSYLNTTHL